MVMGLQSEHVREELMRRESERTSDRRELEILRGLCDAATELLTNYPPRSEDMSILVYNVNLHKIFEEEKQKRYNGG